MLIGSQPWLLLTQNWIYLFGLTIRFIRAWTWYVNYIVKLAPFLFCDPGHLEQIRLNQRLRGRDSRITI